MQTIYVRTGSERYKRMTKFWGKLFVINFAMGVVTGIVQEFQFGMNWSEYSRYVGDIFGAPLAIEALLAFFIESTFLGVWIFGWDRLSKPLHAAAIWLVAIASNLSAFWILVANSFMQSPVGYAEEGGRLVMQQFSALLTNPYVWGQFPHTVFSGFTTAAFFCDGHQRLPSAAPKTGGCFQTLVSTGNGVWQFVHPDGDFDRSQPGSTDGTLTADENCCCGSPVEHRKSCFFLGFFRGGSADHERTGFVAHSAGA